MKLENKLKFELMFIFFFVFVDQIIKFFAMQITEPITIIKNFASLNYLQNFGVAWSMFNGQKFFIIIISLIAIGYLIKLVFEYRGDAFIHFGLLMMVGGAIGNLIDRTFRGFVVDYIDVVIFGYDYPVFNFADSILVCGVILIGLEVVRKVKNGEAI